VKVRQVIKLLKQDGWVQVRMKGSHRQFEHPTKWATITVAGKPGDDMPIGLLMHIRKLAGLKDIMKT